MFLLASVRCAASAVHENVHKSAERWGRPTLLPMGLCRPLCSAEQEEWWAAAYKFATNQVSMIDCSSWIFVLLLVIIKI